MFNIKIKRPTYIYIYVWASNCTSSLTVDECGFAVEHASHCSFSRLQLSETRKLRENAENNVATKLTGPTTCIARSDLDIAGDLVVINNSDRVASKAHQ